MNNAIKVAALLSSDIRSRLNAELIRKGIDELRNYNHVNIGMAGVVFISRSFADELLEIKETNRDKEVSIINADGDVKTMLDVVARSRKNSRVYRTYSADVVRLKDMASLNTFFQQCKRYF